MDLTHFISIENINQLASFLGVSVEKIRRVIYANDYSKNYRLFFLSKKNGDLRVIQAPKGALREIQRKLGKYLTKIYAAYAPEHAHGFVLEKSIVTNAATHIQQNWVMNCDLADFYGSIHYQRVKRLFESSPFHFNSEVAHLLAGLCTTRTGLLNVNYFVLFRVNYLDRLAVKNFLSNFDLVFSLASVAFSFNIDNG